MRERLSAWLAPSVDDADLARRHYLLNLVVLGLAGPGFLFGLAAAVLWIVTGDPVAAAGALGGLGVQPFYLLTHWLGRRGRVRLASYVLVMVLFLLMTGMTLQYGIGHAMPLGYAMVVLAAGTLIGTRAALVFAALSAVAHVSIGTVQARGGLPAAVPPTDAVIAGGLALGMGLLVIVAFDWFSSREMRKALRREQALSAQLRAYQAELEQRVAARTAELTEANERLLSEVAERRRTEDALRESRQMLQSIMDNIPQSIFWKDRESVYLGCNREFAIDAGLDTAEDVVGKTDFDMPWREQVEQYRADDRWVMEMGLSKLNYQELQTTPDGGQIWLRTSKVPLRDASGRVMAVLGMYEDVTERKRAEREVQELARFPSENPHPVLRIARDGTVLSANQASRPLLELWGCRVGQLLPEEWRTLIADVFSSGSREDIEVGYDDRVLSLTVTPILDADYVNVYGLDVTKLVRAQAALREERASLAQRVAERTAELSAANAELTHALRAKDEFLAAMSHELRTPLNAILGLSEALQEGVYGRPNEGQLRSVRTVEESGRHLLELISDILDMAKIGAGKLELDLRPVSVELVGEASLRLVRPASEKKRLKMSSTFDSAVEVVEADERRLKQILVNLLSNSVKFTPEGGTVGLEVVGDVEGGAVHFTVWDTGVGIPEEDMAKLFQPFVQLDSGLARRYGGTGLGLALVHNLAEMHGGGVAVESDVGQGSRFTVSLPWRRGGEETEERGDGETRGQGDRETEQRGLERGEDVVGEGDGGPPAAVVLLAEDNEASLSTLSDYLMAHGYRVLLARDGAEAIEQAREGQPDVILMDAQMPGMDGLEATRRIRADAGLADVPIIALTALAMPGDRERCLRAGADEYLSKPVSLKGLRQVIERQLRGE